jgi:N-acetylmuramoyl-L-alanine amidase
VHINAAPNKKARGVETYVLNVTNDKKSLAVAALENQTTQKSMSDLQGILKDIMLNSKLEESLQLASFVQKEMHNNLYKTSRYDLGVKQAPFYVLVGAKMPAVLVEAGFVSNKNEANMLKTKRYRKEIAEGVFNGISSYLKIFNGE